MQDAAKKYPPRLFQMSKWKEVFIAEEENREIVSLMYIQVHEEPKWGGIFQGTWKFLFLENSIEARNEWEKHSLRQNVTPTRPPSLGQSKGVANSRNRKSRLGTRNCVMR